MSWPRERVTGNGVVAAPVKHPAETAGVVGAVTILVVHLLGVTDAETITAIAILVGAAPAIVTWCVALVRKHNGGA